MAEVLGRDLFSTKKASAHNPGGRTSLNKVNVITQGQGQGEQGQCHDSRSRSRCQGQGQGQGKNWLRKVVVVPPGSRFW